MNNNRYRPLIRLAKKTDQNVYLPSEYNYEISEITNIKKHLPKTLIFVGVDAEQYDDGDKSQFDREKLKLKAVKGKNIVDDSQIKFYRQSQLQLKYWPDIYVCLDLPHNPKKNEESAKVDFDSQVDDFLSQNLWLRNKQTQKRVLSEQKVKLSSACELPTKQFDKQYKQIRLKLPISVIISTKQGISGSSLKDVIKSDVLNCLKIMVKNELPLRVLETRSNIILQSFVSKESDLESEKAKLVNIIDMEKPNLPVEQQNDPAQQSEKKDPSNRTLLMILIALASIYIFLKINPLKSSTLQL